MPDRGAAATFGLPPLLPMLNYIWAGLIVVSLLFALVADVGDLTGDTYRNGQPLAVEVGFPAGYAADAATQPVELRLDGDAVGTFYGLDAAPELAEPLAATLRQTADGRELVVSADAELPAPLTTIRDETNPRDKALQGAVGAFRAAPGAAATSATLTFEPVRFVKMRAISQAALDFAEVAVEIALGLIGVLALFLGLMKIAEEAGVIHALVRVVRPFLGPLFPGVPKDHPAMGMIALNLAANVFGLGNAATPFGIKAMEELQTLNPEPDTATDDMAMLLAMNTASVQLVPPVMLIALIGLEINQVYFAIVATTALSLAVAIVTTRLLRRLRRFRASDPHRDRPAGEPAAPSSTDTAA